MASQAAPFANANSAITQDAQHVGKKIFEQKQEGAPYAQNYPESK